MPVILNCHYCSWSAKDTETSVNGPVVCCDTGSDKWMFLCCDDATARDLADHFGRIKPRDEWGKPAAYKPGVDSDEDFEIIIGPYIKKILRVETYCNWDEVKLTGGGIDSGDLEVLAAGGFEYRASSDGSEGQSDWWIRKPMMLEGKLLRMEQAMESVKRQEDYLKNLEVGGGRGSPVRIFDFGPSDDYQMAECRRQIDQERRLFYELAEELPNMFAANAQVFRKSVLGGMPEFVSFFLGKSPSMESIRAAGNEALVEGALQGLSQIKHLLKENDLDPARLVLACREGSRKEVESLLHVRADFEWNNRLCLIEAVKAGYVEIIKTLQQHGCDLRVGGNQCLQEACEQGNEQVIEYLLSQGVSPDPLSPQPGISSCETDPLGISVEQNKPKIVELLLKAGANPWSSACPNYNDMFCVGAAAFLGHDQCLKLLDQHDCGEFNGVNTPGSYYDWQDEIWMADVTPIHLAVWGGHRSTVELLLQLGAKVDQPDAEGRTALCLACLRGDKVMTEMLVANGANVNVVSSDGRTPLHFVLADYVGAKQEFDDSESTEESEAILNKIIGRIGPDIYTCFSVSDVSWLKSTDGHYYGSGDCVVTFGLSEFMQKTDACRKLETALGQELYPGTWSSYSYEASDLDAGLIVPLSAIIDNLGDVDADPDCRCERLSEIQDAWHEVCHDSDSDWGEFHEEYLWRVEELVDELLGEHGLPLCAYPFIYSENSRIMFGSDIFDDYDQIHVVFGIEGLYESREDMVEWRKDIGSPGVEGIAVVSY